MDPANHRTARIDDADLNILLVGESGVGKSTLINSTINYLVHGTLEEAVRKPLTCLIPAKFSIPDENYITREVHIHSDNNEDRVLGNSSTQGPKSYVFPTSDNSVCRIIDSAGIGDARGLTKDGENFQHLLAHISQYKYLHGICFLLKPDVTVINPYFKFCLVHLLSKLEKSASKNIIFIFTNSRSAFYGPGKTLALLRRILDEIEQSPPYVKIPCDKENIFCVDNEAFEFLVAMKQGIKFRDRVVEAFGQSWLHSCETIKSLLTYVQHTKTNMPHRVENTCSVNDARRNILDLCTPLADVTNNIQKTLTELNRHIEELNVEHLSNEELKKRLVVPAPMIHVIELDNPVTVCSSNKCSELITTGGILQRHYKKRCHNPCYLKDVPGEEMGFAKLRHCYAMQNGKCRFCECDFSAHMHIYYETELKLVKTEDEHVKSQVMSREELIEKKNEIIRDIKKKCEDLKIEKNTIVTTMARFAFFLEENSISPYNDAYLQYLNHLIDREESMGSSGSSELLAHYDDLKQTYQTEMAILKDAKNNASNKKISLPSISQIYEVIKKLCNLAWSGKTIKKTFEEQRKLRKKEVSRMEYVHPVPVTINYRNKSKFDRNPQNSARQRSPNNCNVNRHPNKLNNGRQHFNQNPNTYNQSTHNYNQNPGDFKSTRVGVNSTDFPQNHSSFSDDLSPNTSNQSTHNYSQNPSDYNSTPVGVNSTNYSQKHSNSTSNNDNLNPENFNSTPVEVNPTNIPPETTGRPSQMFSSIEELEKEKLYQLFTEFLKTHENPVNVNINSGNDGMSKNPNPDNFQKADAKENSEIEKSKESEIRNEDKIERVYEQNCIKPTENVDNFNRKCPDNDKQNLDERPNEDPPSYNTLYGPVENPASESLNKESEESDESYLKNSRNSVQ